MLSLPDGCAANARYTSLQTQLEHNIITATINPIRLDVYWTGNPSTEAGTSHLACLDFTLISRLLHRT